MSKLRKLVIPGGGGYLGTRVARHFATKGWKVVILSRTPRNPEINGVRMIAWNPTPPQGTFTTPAPLKEPDAWVAEIEGAEAVLNLTGRTVNCRYNDSNMREIYDSRLRPTQLIGKAIAAAKVPPKVWLNSSSATIYRHAEERPMDELNGEYGKGFSVDVCRKWEAALETADTPLTRKVALRSAMVFGTGEEGVFGAFRRIVKLGLGGTLGNGRQFVSWIHETDFLAALEHLIEHAELAGPVNLASPHPLPNRDFMRIFRETCGQKVGLPANKLMLEIGALFLGTETELLLKSRRVIPARLLEDGFVFQHPQFAEACQEIIGRWED